MKRYLWDGHVHKLSRFSPSVALYFPVVRRGAGRPIQSCTPTRNQVSLQLSRKSSTSATLERSSHPPLHILFSDSKKSPTLPPIENLATDVSFTAETHQSGAIKIWAPKTGRQISSMTLRDACKCTSCVDPSTRQRNFSLAHIPLDIGLNSAEHDSDGNLIVSWTRDIPGFQQDHVSTYSIKEQALLDDRASQNIRRTRSLWTKDEFTKNGLWTEYASFINDDSVVLSVLKALYRHGLVFITMVPSEESSVSTIAQRIGPFKNTFYGQTWDVRSVPNPRNVAYTSKYLEFHMDLLYLKQPPRLQLLHCLQNSCSGGESLFADSFKAAKILEEQNYPDFKELSDRRNRVHYSYINDGQHYERSHPVLVSNSKYVGGNKTKSVYSAVYWSPPFTSGFTSSSPKFISALKRFSDLMESDDLTFEVKIDEGTCAIFDNTRVVHARKSFDMNSGKRWLRGAYIDEDAYASKLKVMESQVDTRE